VKVSHEWLGEMVDLEGVEPAQVADILTLSGTEVEKVTPFGVGLDQVVVGEVVGLRRVDGSDHLFLAHVAIPGLEPREVVCGADNLFLGALVPWARPGTRLPIGAEIGRKRLRGIWSEGMLCAPDELGLGSDHDGVLILSPEDAEVGTPLGRVYPADHVYELEVLSNRADCLSHWGVARELSALLSRPLRDPEASRPERSSSAPAVRVTVASNADCPVYLAEVLTGFTNASAPYFVRRRLAAIGQRSLGGIVDLANYVMFEIGQPLHTFDLDCLPAPDGELAVAVRRGRHGESLTCLDGVNRQLDPETLVITVGDAPQAVAGLIGGQESAVGPDTGRVLLEAANFNWARLRSTSRRLRLRTEASGRFERQLSPHLAKRGADRFIHLAVRHLGAKLGPGAEGGAPPAPAEAIRCDPVRISSILGLDLGPEAVASPLRRLQFEVRQEGGEMLVTPSPYRTDVTAPVDLAEEVGRIIGYQQVPGTLPAIRQAPPLEALPEPVARLTSAACRAAGFSEALSLSLVSGERERAVPRLGGDIAHLELANPLSTQLGSLRQGLLQGLLQSAHHNQARGQDRIRLFEQGAAFWARGEDRPEEPWMLAALDLADDSAADGVTRLRRLMALVAHLSRVGGGGAVEFRPVTWPALHRARAAEVWSGSERRGIVGEVAQAVADAFDVRGRVEVFELRLDGWLKPGGRPGHAPPLPRMPALVLDLSVTVPSRALLGPALQAVAALRLPELELVTPIDEYLGDQLGPGVKGWTLRLRLRHPERTLTAAEGDMAREAVLRALELEVGARPR
jgi:phenylalanyl-tRNA synthetase beta chain